jgi:hypothetical protein
MINLFIIVWLMVGALWLIPALIAKFTHHPRKKSVYWISVICFLIGNPTTTDFLQLNALLWVLVMIYATVGRKLFKSSI